jgi:hypothetical protein
MYLSKEVWMEVVIGGGVGMESESLRDTVHLGKFNIMFWREKKQPNRNHCNHSN